jgi:sigma-B regulation protein RsbU (phosphoserine phosphatase)
MACSQQNTEPETAEVDTLTPVETSLDDFASTLSMSPIDPTTLSDQVRQYMETSPENVFGATVVLLDSTGMATAAPYWYRDGSSYGYVDLMDSMYTINSQPWLTTTKSSDSSIWTDPYFDEGGGNVWMRTRTVPIRVNGVLVAIATSDIQVEDPGN